ncbi:MAG: hypothetical protein PHO94_02240 [Petrimonas sp.]|nr:hypothetical protein [Petrimonas sp.]
MKKVTKFLMMAAIVFGFAACNNEVPNPGNDEGNVWASFTIALPTGGAGTRAETTDVPSANAGDTYIGTAGEQVVNAVRVELYDGVQVAYAFDFAITADGTNPFTGADVSTNGTAATRSTFVTKAEKVVEKSYKALVLLNPTAASITATQKGNNISQVEQAITATVADLTTPAFLMSNSQGLVDVPTTALKATDVAAEQAPVAVKVDRAVAKVFVGGTPTVEQGATFTGIQWTLDVPIPRLS